MHNRRLARRLALFLSAIIIISIIGYGIWREFKIAFLPNLGGYSLLAVSIVGGIAAFFSPCSFTFLPSYISYSLAMRDGKVDGEAGLTAGISSALGVITFDLILGVAAGVLGASFLKSFALGVSTPSTGVRVFRALVGATLIALGAAQLYDINLHNRLSSAIGNLVATARKGGRYTASFAYGFFYSVIGIGCIGPILASVIVFAVASGGFNSALLTFLIFAATMALLMLAITVLVFSARNRALRWLQTTSPTIKKFGGIVLLLVGAALVISAVFAGLYVKVFWP